MITKKMIEQARKDRERSLLVSSAIISLSGLFLMVIALWHIMDYDSNLDSVPFHVLFMFGGILSCFGIFTAPGEK